MESEEPVKYLCLTYQDESRSDGLSLAETDVRSSEEDQALRELQAGGNLVVSSNSIPAQTATTVRVRNGRMVITDGPSGPGKDQLTGFFVIEARDLNEALRLSARMPVAKTGVVEVRPVQQLFVDTDEPRLVTQS
jgi:hypothetical protein